MKQAKLYNNNPDRSVDCFLCRHMCHIADGKRGICMVRENKNGTLYSLFYGKPIAMAVDPIEKKPLYHFYPGTKSLSIATVGCNFQCPFCQNWDISQFGRIANERALNLPQADYSPETIVKMAKENGCGTIAYTYSEPTIFYEYSYDIAKLAAKIGIKNIYVTNGYMTREMLNDFGPLLHTANIDLKAFNKKTYKTMLKGNLDGVLDSIKYMKELGIWIEITTLIVTGMNDSRHELKDIADFIAAVGVDIPWHISRFHPAFNKTDIEATSLKTMEMAYDLGKAAGLRYIYIGNLPAGDKENTFCYKCNSKLISRNGFYIEENLIKDSMCNKCGAKIDGAF